MALSPVLDAATKAEFNAWGPGRYDPRHHVFDGTSSRRPRPRRRIRNVSPSHELGALMESAIDRLSDGAREVLVLRQVEGMTTGEVAESLGVSEAVVKTRLSRARASLRRDLSERAGLAAPHTFRFLRPRCDRVVAAVLDRIL